VCPSLTSLLAGVTVGDPVLRTGKPLSVELGPGEPHSLVIFTSQQSRFCAGFFVGGREKGEGGGRGGEGLEN